MIKKLLGITALTLIANAGLACPDLAGAYTCSDEDAPYTETVTQRVVDGVTRYTIQSEGEDKTKVVTLSGSCFSNGPDIYGTQRKSDVTLSINDIRKLFEFCREKGFESFDVKLNYRND